MFYWRFNKHFFCLSFVSNFYCVTPRNKLSELFRVFIRKVQRKEMRRLAPSILFIVLMEDSK